MKSILKFIGRIFLPQQAGSLEEWHRLEFSKEYPKKPHYHHSFDLINGGRK
ncbi:MAG: hypothetical protein H6620_09950 [Halobacteriovoraceae bacterium]|nr:hypothetical protein [Halobacteriovoraceae bacterium]